MAKDQHNRKPDDTDSVSIKNNLEWLKEYTKGEYPAVWMSIDRLRGILSKIENYVTDENMPSLAKAVDNQIQGGCSWVPKNELKYLITRM